MIRTDAVANAAEMIELQAVGDGTALGFIEEPVSEHIVSVHPEDAVSGYLGSRPYPARTQRWGVCRDGAVFIDLRPESLRNGSDGGHPSVTLIP